MGKTCLISHSDPVTTATATHMALATATAEPEATADTGLQQHQHTDTVDTEDTAVTPLQQPPLRMATATHTAQLMLEHTVELMVQDTAVQDTADPHTPGMAMDTQALLQHTQAMARAPTAAPMAAPTAAPMLQVPMVMDM